MKNWISTHEDLVVKLIAIIGITMLVIAMVFSWDSVWGVDEEFVENFIPEVNVGSTAMDELTVTLLEEYAEFYE